MKTQFLDEEGLTLYDEKIKKYIDDNDANTVYTHPTTAGNKHIPSGGATGQVLKYSASGTAVWGNLEKIATSEPTDQAVGDFWLLAY